MVSLIWQATYSPFWLRNSCLKQKVVLTVLELDAKNCLYKSDN